MLNFSLCGDNIECSNRLAFREEETDLVGFAGIVMIKLQMLRYIQKDSERECNFYIHFFDIQYQPQTFEHIILVLPCGSRKDAYGPREVQIVPEYCRKLYFLLKIISGFFSTVCFCCPVDKTNYNSFSLPSTILTIDTVRGQNSRRV